MYWFLRVNKNAFRLMTKQDVENFVQQHSFSDIEKQIIKYLSLGCSTTEVMIRTSLNRQELYKHYETIAKELTQEW